MIPGKEAQMATNAVTLSGLAPNAVYILSVSQGGGHRLALVESDLDPDLYRLATDLMEARDAESVRLEQDNAWHSEDQ
jgi:hypothetical protein